MLLLEFGVVFFTCPGPRRARQLATVVVGSIGSPGEQEEPGAEVFMGSAIPAAALRQELATNVDPEVSVQRRHVLVDRIPAQPELPGHLLLAVAVKEAGEGLPEAGRQPFE